MKKILVTDGWTRKSLTVVRSLGIKNLEVHVTGHKPTSPARFSKYTKKFFLTPNPEKNPYKYTEKLLHIIETNNYDCIMPLEEVTMELFYNIRPEIEKHTKLPLTNYKTFMKAYDKWETLKIAKKLKIPMPESYLPQKNNEISNAIKKLGFPLIIKPRKSSGSRGLKKICCQKEFDNQYPIIKKKYGSPILQKYIGSKGQGNLVGFIMENKKILGSFTYKRLREFPVNGGPGTMWESTNNKEIRELGGKILRHLDWYGIAMVEFKYDPIDGKPKLMEINPRFWGSLALPLASGINFPYLLYTLSQGKTPPVQTYIYGVKCRWLIPGDILHFFSNKDRFDLHPSFFKFFDNSLIYDQLTKDDIKGSIASIMYALSSIFDIEMWKKVIFRK